MMYPRNLKEENKHWFELKEKYGHENVWEMEGEFEVSEVDWIKMHLGTPLENLKNGLEIRLDEEDYETADIINKIIKWLESDEEEIVFELKNTEGFTKFKVKK